jgi:hypothetical protein
MRHGVASLLVGFSVMLAACADGGGAGAVDSSEPPQQPAPSPTPNPPPSPPPPPPPGWPPRPLPPPPPGTVLERPILMIGASYYEGFGAASADLVNEWSYDLPFASDQDCAFGSGFAENRETGLVMVACLGETDTRTFQYDPQSGTVGKALDLPLRRTWRALVECGAQGRCYWVRGWSDVNDPTRMDSELIVSDATSRVLVRVPLPDQTVLRAPWRTALVVEDGREYVYVQTRVQTSHRKGSTGIYRFDTATLAFDRACYLPWDTWAMTIMGSTIYLTVFRDGLPETPVDADVIALDAQTCRETRRLVLPLEEIWHFQMYTFAKSIAARKDGAILIGGMGTPHPLSGFWVFERGSDVPTAFLGGWEIFEAIQAKSGLIYAITYEGFIVEVDPEKLEFKRVLEKPQVRFDSRIALIE